MNTYITLLRGINVGGNKKIKMEDLRNYCESIGATEVSTYIQSGNIVFRHPDTDLQGIAQSIGIEIEKRSGFTAWVVVFPLDYWQKVIAEFPFSHINDLNPSRTLAVFYEHPLSTEHLQAIDAIDLKNDLSVVKEKTQYIYCPDGISNSPLADATLQKKIKIENTSRNWRTVLKLEEMASQISLG